MSRPALFALVVLASLFLVGCTTSEIKNTNDIGLVDNVPNASSKSGYGDGKGDSVGGGGAAPPDSSGHGHGADDGHGHAAGDDHGDTSTRQGGH